MLVRTAIEEFLIACEADGLKASTRGWYRQMLNVFEAHYGDADLGALDSRAMRAFVIEVRQREEAASTRADRLRALRRFWTWAAKEYTLENPMDRIRQTAQPKPYPRAIALEDFKKLYEACSDNRIGHRDRAILVMLADTGVRAQGLLMLTPEDVDFAHRRAIVREKFDKLRVVPFTALTSYLVERWCKVRPLQAETLFCTDDGGGLTYWGLRQILRRLALRANVTGRWNAHSFRHFAAREYLRNGGNLATLAQLLGHSDVSTTANHYAVFDSDELTAMHDAHSALHSVWKSDDDS
jgi:site-specific recombinase XerD